MGFSYQLKKKKITKQIKQILSEIIHFEVRDYRIQSEHLSIIAVELDDNFRKAKIYYTILNEENKEKIQTLLKRMNGFLRGKLKLRLKTKFLPELNFIFKKSQDAQMVIDLIEKIK